MARFCLSCSRVTHCCPITQGQLQNGVPVTNPPRKAAAGVWGWPGPRFSPSFASPCCRQPPPLRCWAAVTGSPRCSLLCTLFFLALRSRRHFKTESKSKRFWLTSSPLLPLSFLEQFMNKRAIFPLRSVRLQCYNLDCEDLFSAQKWQMFATGTAGKTHPRFLQWEVKVQARFLVEI